MKIHLRQSEEMRQLIGRLVIVLAVIVAVPGSFTLAEDGVVFSPNSLVWQATIGTSPSQSVAIFLDNTRCPRPADVEIVLYFGDGTTESVRKGINPFTGEEVAFKAKPTASDDGREILSARVALAPGPCGAQGRFQVSGATVNADRTTRLNHIFYIAPRDDSIPIRSSSLPPQRVGPGQSIEFAVWNGCSTPIVAEFETIDLFTGESSVAVVEVDPLALGAVVPSTSDSEEVKLVGFGTFTVRERGARQGRSCSRRPAGAFISASLVNADGSTATKILPSGKRRHQPFTVVPRDDR